MEHKELTKAEEQVMHFVWELGRGFLKDIVDRFPAPPPAYTTISTVIRVLVKKGFLGYKIYGKVHEYFPLISKSQYFKSRMRPVITKYFSGSHLQLASYFAHENMSLSELEEIKLLIDEKIKKLKTKRK